MEFVIESLTEKEEAILESSDIDWYPDDLNTRDIVVHGTEEDVDKILHLIGRR